MIFNKINLEKKNIFILIIGIFFSSLIYWYLFMGQLQLTGDGIFTYSLSNNPYERLFIGAHLKEFKNIGGWIEGELLKSTYTVTEKDRFNYGAMYYHQLSDVHPILYNTIIHTLCSIFIGSSSPIIALSVNYICLIGIDVILYMIWKKFNINAGLTMLYASLLIWVLSEMMYPRSYMLLIFASLVYFYIHTQLASHTVWKKRYLLYLMVSIFIGEMTHYYFYVYAVGTSLVMLIVLVRKKEFYKLVNYIMAGLMGFWSGIIVYPWVVKHIYLDSKHEIHHTWNIEFLKTGFDFFNVNLFNGRIAVFIIMIILLFAGCFLIKVTTHREMKLPENRISLFLLTFCPVVFHVLVIGTLDGFSWIYLSPIIFPLIILVVWMIERLTAYLCGGGQNLPIIMAALLILMVLNPLALFNRVQQIRASQAAYHTYWDFVEEHKADDCIYIADAESTTINNLYFSLGEYDEFKPIWISEIDHNQLEDSILEGRSTASNFVVIYVPENYALDTSDYVYVTGLLYYNVYLWEVNT